MVKKLFILFVFSLLIIIASPASSDFLGVGKAWKKTKKLYKNTLEKHVVKPVTKPVVEYRTQGGLRVGPSQLIDITQ